MSSYAYDYQDLICAPVPLQYFAEACDCSLDTIKNWGRVGRGIPEKYAGVISQAFHEIFSNNKDLTNDTKQKDIFFNENNDLKTENELENLISLLESSGFAYVINDLREEPAQLGTTRKSQSIVSENHLQTALDSLPFKPKKKVKAENPPSLRSAFSFIKPFQPLHFFSAEKDKNIKILTAPSAANFPLKDKKLKSSTKNTCEYIDLDGMVYKFHRKFIESMGGWRPTNEWVHIPSQDYLLTERYALHETARRLLPDFSIFGCQHFPISGNAVGILCCPDHDSARFFGLQNCNSPWSCPTCAVKISNRRANELKIAYEKHKSWGGVFSFVTRTAPHKDIDSLLYMLERFIDAEKKLKEKRAYKDLKLLFGVIGSVKVYEITVTLNGWHLHVHEIYFHESEEVVTAAGGEDWLFEIEELMFPIWHKSAIAAGFDAPSREHGLKVQNGDFAADYIAKYGHEPSENFWGVEREMSKQHLKRSRKGLSPFDLLRQYEATGQKFYADLFQEFARCMKGKQQLIWSRGLKDYFSIDEKTDEEIAEEQEETAFVLGYFGEHWKEVRNRKVKAKLLILGRSGDFEAVRDFMRSLGLDFYTPEEYRALKNLD